MLAPGLAIPTGSSIASTQSSPVLANVWHDPPPFPDSLDLSPDLSAPTSGYPHFIGATYDGNTRMETPPRSGQTARPGSAPAFQSSCGTREVSRMRARTHGTMVPTSLQALEAQMAANMHSTCHTAPQYPGGAIGTPPAMEVWLKRLCQYYSQFPYPTARIIHNLQTPLLPSVPTYSSCRHCFSPHHCFMLLGA
jgi:hypothetical protein